MKITFKLLLILISGFIINSCGDCTLEPLTQLSCAPREATVTQFNANVVPKTVKDSKGEDSTYLEPVPEFSIHSFQFPGNDQTSGSTPNDFRFTKNSTIFYGTIAFNVSGKTYFAQIEQSLPFNNDINGDFIVVSEDAVARTAKIRFNGFVKNIVSDLGNDFLKDNSKDFCNDIIQKLNNDQNKIETIRKNKTAYGAGTVTKPSFTQADFKVYDANGTLVVDPAITSQAPKDKIDSKIAELNSLKTAYDTDIKLGEVYYFQSAITGREFIFAITDISKGTLAPFKYRLTIMFSALDRR